MTTESPHWYKSSHSSNGGDCIEVGADVAVSHGIVPVRDSKNPDGPVLDIPAGAFTSFVNGVKAGGSPRWSTSSYSNNGGACVEVATNLVASHGVVPVRDSKQISGPVLTLTPRAFTGLVALARRTHVS